MYKSYIAKSTGVNWKSGRYALVGVTALMLSAPSMVCAEPAQFDIPAQPLGAALRAFATQAQMELLYEQSTVANIQGNAVSGELEKDAALEELLRNTGLEIVYRSERAATIRPSDRAKQEKPNAEPPGSQSPRAGRDGVFRSTRNLPDSNALEEIIVTGVMDRQSIVEAPIAIGVVSEEQMKQQATGGSAVEVLKNVPGLYVSSADGEIRSVVFSRGVSAYSSEPATGYYYVSLQEDGLAVQPATVSNLGPDFFTRTDIMLSRVEALRGGTAAITGPNAPGGIFNYISRTGKSDPGLEVRSRFGLEGNIQNAYYRGDVYAGGQVGDSSLYYALGGFYRRSEGARDMDYDANKGGQIRGNLLWEYDAGSLQMHGKYLNDHTGFFSSLPAVNFEDPKIAPGFSNRSSLHPMSADSTDYPLAQGGTRHFDPEDLIHCKSWALGIDWKHDFSDQFRFGNRSRLSRNRSQWNALALDPILPLNDFIYNFLAGNLLGPGTFTFRFPNTGGIAAVMREDLVDLGGGNYFPTLTVTQNNLPNQHLLPNAMVPGVAFSPRFTSRDFQDELTFTASLNEHTVSVGGFVSLSKVTQIANDAGLRFAPYERDPRNLQATFESDFIPGAVYQVTNPSGWANINGFVGGDEMHADQEQYSIYAGDSWKVTDKFSLEAGIRYEKIKFDVRNDTVAQFAGNRLLAGGLDQNPLTLYDNGPVTFGEEIRTQRDFDFFNYSLSLAHRFSDRLNTYIRYTDGKKSPDLGVISQIDTPAEVAEVFPKEQRIQQLEFGFKFREGVIDAALFPFYSRLSKVADLQLFFDDTGQMYSPPPLSGKIKTYGVEFQGALSYQRFNLNTAITLQRPRASDFGRYVENTPSRDDDVLVSIPSGKADYNPKIISRTTATVLLPGRTQVFVTHSYLGSRPANRYNAFDLPGFHTVDVGGSLAVTDSLELQLNINNVFNEYGIMGWAQSGGFLSAIDRQSLTSESVNANPRGPMTVSTTPSRSLFLTATVKF